MNDERGTPDEEQLRIVLAPDDSIAPLDPARVIAGARRRRVRGRVAAAGASVAVVAVVAVAGIAGSGQLRGDVPQPANPGPSATVRPTTPSPTRMTPTTPEPTPTMPPTRPPGTPTARPTSTPSLTAPVRPPGRTPSGLPTPSSPTRAPG
ncbi:hypothetical protein [Kribbella sp. VKM Ac-2569]|uniref:hypothetical protein n=1 Tax=Kribbella sp. VKM Ac-2569 TaxID=2512220 RepID=UPI00102B5A1C|nr:hypothetical protein [Kribbella sp. VKM Ac-2569]